MEAQHVGRFFENPTLLGNRHGVTIIVNHDRLCFFEWSQSIKL